MIRKKMMSLVNFKGLGLFLMVLLVLMAGSAYGAVSVLNQPDCQDLIAGQSINVGDVCLEVVGDNLVVTYTTTDGWELTEAHLWVGANIADMPQTKKGNPKIGNFPYNSGDITGAASYSFSVPLASLGSDLCDMTYFAAAHAVVRKADGSGGYQTETGWASGDPMVPQGSWAMYFSFLFVCDTPPSPEPICETAFAFGDKKLWDIIDPETGDPITNRWGWQITVNAGDTFTRQIWAGAAQNDTSKGTYVGDLQISYDGSTLTVNYVMNAPFFMQETHLYAGTVETDTASPGQFGNLHDLDNATFDSYQIMISGSTVYVVAHAVVCHPGN